MRHTRPFLLLTVLAGALCAAGFKTVNYLDADAIMAKVHDTHSADAEVDIIEMVSVTKDAKTNAVQTTTLKLLSAVQKDKKGNVMYLMRVLAPDAQKGVAFLMLEGDGGAVDQYVITALGSKKILPENRGSSFFNTDFTYEDLRREKPGEWKYDRLDDEKIEGTDCYAIMATPANKEREKITGYTYRFLDIDKATYDIRRVVFLDSKQKELKVFDARDYQPTNNAVQRPRSGEMRNLVSGTYTIMSLENSRVNQPIDDKFFSLDTLKNWGADQDKLISDLQSAAAKPAGSGAKKP